MAGLTYLESEALQERFLLVVDDQASDKTGFHWPLQKMAYSCRCFRTGGVF